MPLRNPPHIIASVDLMTDYDDVFDTSPACKQEHFSANNQCK